MNLNKPNITLVHLCLLTLMVWTPTTWANSVQQLPAGVTLKDLGTVYKKAFDLPFTLNTKLNVTHDLEVIDNAARDFQKETWRYQSET